MDASSIRRPIPAIVFILLLSLVSGLVWWRVLHRDPAQGTTTGATAGSSSTASATKTPPRCVTVTGRPPVWPAPKSVTVRVLNATNRSGLAGSVTKAMKKRGFKAVKPGDDAASADTEVRYGPGGASAARLVQLYLPGSRLVSSTVKSSVAKSGVVVVSLGTSYKALATSAQVTKAKATGPAARSCH